MQLRIEAVAHLRRLVNLPPHQDISERQWAVLEPRLAAMAAGLTARVKKARDEVLPRAGDQRARRRFHETLGRVELELARAYAFFDTYMDVLSQRRVPMLGAQLAGCDVLACDAMRLAHPALEAIEPPLVYCDRGFGAAIMRESVRMPDGSPNPMPLIQVPYSRLQEKYNLTSILHEAGHQALQRLDLVRPLAGALAAAASREGRAGLLPDLYRLWSSEIAPDFWAFCLSGVAEASAVRELFALPLAQATRISMTDPHPPPYLRALLVFDWCRHAWGRGVWDDWEREWRGTFDLNALPPDTRRLLVVGQRLVPAIGAALFNQRFAELERRRLTDLFDLDSIAPSRVRPIAASVRTGVLNLRKLRPCAQLSVFGELRAHYRIPEARLDRLMTQWLVRLGTTRHALN
jgi:hypothetical protein